MCRDDHILEISSWSIDWKKTFESEQAVIDIAHQEDGEQQMEKVLMKWKEQEGPGATYRKLYATLRSKGNMEIANRVYNLATKGRWIKCRSDIMWYMQVHV